MGYMVDTGDTANPESGIAVSTLGKVIKRGWDWLGLAPAEAASVSGLVEVPALAEALTLNKADFIRTGQKGATFLAYRKAIQEPVAKLLMELGDAPRPSTSRRPRTRTLERDLRSVLSALSGDFPLIATLVEHRAGGQSRLALGDPGSPGTGLVPALGTGAGPAAPPPAEEGPTGPAGGGAPPQGGDTGPGRSTRVPVPGGRKRKRPSTLGLSIRFDSRPDDPSMGRLVESTVWVNEAHPAYRRALASRSEGYHLAATVALTLAPLAVEPARVQEFVTAFLGRWGEV